MRIDPRRAQWLRAAASAVLLGACLWLVDFGDVVGAVRGLDPLMFALAFALNGIGTVMVRAWIAHLAAGASGIQLGGWALLRVNLVARFYTLVLPRGAAAAVRWKHYVEGGAAMAASALLLFETLVAMATLFGTAALALALVPERGEIGRMLLPLAWLGFTGSLATLLPFVHAPSARLAGRFNRTVLGRSPRLAGLAERFLAAVATYQQIPRRTIAGIVAVSLFGYVLFVFSAWVLLEAMDLAVGLAAIAWIRSVTLLLALIPISIAGLGVREASFIAFLGEYGVTSGQAFAFSMATFTIQLILGAMGAAIELARVFRRPEAPP